MSILDEGVGVLLLRLNVLLMDAAVVVGVFAVPALARRHLALATRDHRLLHVQVLIIFVLFLLVNKGGVDACFLRNLFGMVLNDLLL